MCVKPNEDISLTKCELLCIVYGIILTLFCYLFGVVGYSGTQKCSPVRTSPLQTFSRKGTSQGSTGRTSRSGLHSPKPTGTSIPRPGSASKLPGLRR